LKDEEFFRISRNSKVIEGFLMKESLEDA
jgi:hypothetical protein